MSAPQITKLGQVSWKVGVQVHSRERSHSRIIVSAKRERKGAPFGRFGLKQFDERTGDAAISILAVYHNRMKFPDALPCTLVIPRPIQRRSRSRVSHAQSPRPLDVPTLRVLKQD